MDPIFLNDELAEAFKEHYPEGTDPEELKRASLTDLKWLVDVLREQHKERKELIDSTIYVDAAGKAHHRRE